MERECIGAIDIGSNAIRLLINYVERGENVEFKKATFIRVPIRLGEDVFTSGEIGSEKREQLSLAMGAFSNLLSIFKVKRYRACATSAMREAKNSEEVISYIRESSGINIDIISGKEEADTIFTAGTLSGAISKSGNYLFVDVGGGSTELTVFIDGKKRESESFPLGTVRIISNAANKDDWKALKRLLSSYGERYKFDSIVGSGGNINKVHKLLGKGSQEHIRHSEVKSMYETLSSMSYDERITGFGLNSYRADVIIPALKIFMTVCKECDVDTIFAPKIGLADGIIRTLYEE